MGRKKIIKSLNIFLFLLVLLPSIFALEITNDPKSTFSADLQKGTASISIDVKVTQNTENGLFELQFVPTTLAQTFITGTQVPCQANTPYNQHVSYSGSIGNTGKITISLPIYL